MRDFDPTASEFISSGYLTRSHAGSGFFGDPGSLLGAGASIVGGLIGSNAAGDAADAQAASAAASTAEQRRQYDLTRADNAPWRDAGAQGVNRLAYLLGLGNPSGAPSLSAEQLRNELIGQYTTKGTPGASGGYRFNEVGSALGEAGYWTPDPGTPDRVDEAGLNAAINARLNASQGPANADGLYGSLLKKFGVEDFQVDPGYQFRQQEGQKGVERSAASRGGLFSGAAGKALTRYNQDFASNEYGNAYNRYNTDQTNIYNRLAGISGIGQQAQGQVNQAGSNMANNVSNNLIGAGNAQAAGGMAQAGFMTNGLNSAFNSYNQSNALRGGNYGQAAFSQTGLGSSGFGTGLAYGNQDYGQYF